MTADNDDLNFAYKKYSLEHVDEWIHDALNCDDITPQEIYDTIVKSVDEDIEYHKKQLTKSIDLLSLLKGQTSVDYELTNATDKDWEDFWHSPEAYGTWESSQYTEEELDAMCDAAEEKEKCREYNLREAEYYNKRAELDAEYEEIKKRGGYELTYPLKGENS